MKKKETCFVRITNEDIYKKLEDIEVKLNKNCDTTEWHTRAFYAVGSVLMAIVGWIIYISAR